MGDSAFCPYGAKSGEVLRERVGGIVEFFLKEGAEVIVLACNSATIQAIKWCRERWPEVAFVGMEPGVKPAVKATRSQVIGVLATEASLTGEMFAELVEEECHGCEVLTQACPKFVELVEGSILAGPEVDEAIWEYGGPLVMGGADVLGFGVHSLYLFEGGDCAGLSGGDFDRYRGGGGAAGGRGVGEEG